MKAIVLAGGFSTRLYPLTEYFPKALLPIGGKAILSYTLDQLVRIKLIDGIALISNHRYSGIFKPWLRAEYGKKIRLFDNMVSNPEQRFGSIGDLLYVLTHTGWHDDIIVVASDTLTSLSLSEFISFFGKHRGIVTAVYKTSDPSIIAGKLGCAIIDGAKLVAFVEKPEIPQSPYTGVPFYIFPREVLSLIRQYFDEGNASDAPGSILPWLLTKVPAFAFDVSGYYYDVGTLEMYNTVAGSTLQFSEYKVK